MADFYSQHTIQKYEITLFHLLPDFISFIIDTHFVSNKLSLKDGMCSQIPLDSHELARKYSTSQVCFGSSAPS